MMRPCDYENVSPIYLLNEYIVRNSNVFLVDIGKYLGLTTLMQNNAPISKLYGGSASMLYGSNALLFSSTKKMIIEYDSPIGHYSSIDGGSA